LDRPDLGFCSFCISYFSELSKSLVFEEIVLNVLISFDIKDFPFIKDPIIFSIFFLQFIGHLFNLVGFPEIILD